MGYTGEEKEKLIDKLENGKRASTRESAAYELGFSGLTNVITNLRKAYNNDKNSNVKIAALWSIAEIDIEKARKILSRALYDKEWDIRYEAISIINYSELTDYSDELGCLLYDDEDPDVRAMAAYTLGELNIRSAINDLLYALKKDESKQVRANAAEAICKINPEHKNAIKELKNRLFNDGNYEVRSSCAKALSNIKSEEIKSILLKVLKTDRSSLVRVKVLDLLSIYDPISEIEFLEILREAISTDPNSNVRNKAVELFGEKGAKEELHRILRSDVDYDIGLNVRDQLEMIAEEQGYESVQEMISEMDKKGIDLKTKLLSIEPINIRERMLMILTLPMDKDKSNKIIDTLIDILICDDFDQFSNSAAQRLSVIRNDYLESKLLQLLEEDSDYKTKVAALGVLRNIGSKKIVDTLRDIILNEDELSLKELAIESILNIDVENNKKLLYNCLDLKIAPIVLISIMDSLYLIDEIGIKTKLLRLLKSHKSARIRSKTIELLKNYPSRDVIDLLLKSKFEDRSFNIRNTASRVLDELAHKETGLIKERTIEYQKKQHDIEYDSVETEDNYFVGNDEKLTILFAAANPEDSEYLRQGNEIKQITSVLRESGLKEKFEIKQEWALTKKDFSRILFEYNPDILHISCHGAHDGSLLLEDKNNESHPVSLNEIVKLFRICKEEDKEFKLKLLFISACNSELLANEISKYVDYVVAMLDSITDESATEFAGQFYEKIVLGKTIITAFRVGCNYIAEKEEEKIPDLFNKITTSQKHFIIKK